MQAMQAAGVSPHQLQMVLQHRLSHPSVARPMSSAGAVQPPSRLTNAARQGLATAYSARPSFAAAFTKTLSTSSSLAAFKAPLPPPNAASLPKAEKRKYDTLRLV